MKLTGGHKELCTCVPAGVCQLDDIRFSSDGATLNGHNYTANYDIIRALEVRTVITLFSSNL